MAAIPGAESSNPPPASASQGEFAKALFQHLPSKERAELGLNLVDEIETLAHQALEDAGTETRLCDWVRPKAARASGGRAPALFRIANRDMPFLVDSILNTLLAEGAEASILLHPVFRVVRDNAGRPTSIGVASVDHQTTSSRAGQRESLILIGVNTISADEADRIVSEIKTTLSSVAAAVRDWQPMLQRFGAAVDALETTTTSAPDDQKREAVEFARWLVDGQFVFLGMREFRLIGDAETGVLEVVDGSSLGVLEDSSVHVLRRGQEMVALTPEIRRFYFEPQPLFVTKSNVISRVHRGVHMDYVGLKTYEPDGRLRGELRVVGLFTSKAYTMPPGEIPMLRLRVERVIAQSGYVPGSHDAKALINVVDTFPRDELFQIPVGTLAEWAPQIVDLETRPRTRVFARIDRFDRFVSVQVYLARERFSTVVRERIGQ
ncbi:MAG: NAD-glutamate dehydrogenase, partial [Pseudomonadota bacterium]